MHHAPKKSILKHIVRPIHEIHHLAREPINRILLPRRRGNLRHNDRLIGIQIVHVLYLVYRGVPVCPVIMHPEIIGRVAGDFTHEIRDPGVTSVIARAGRADEFVALVSQGDYLAVPGVGGLLRRNAGALGLVEVVDYAVVRGLNGGPVLAGEFAEVVDHGAEGGAVLELWGGPGVPVAEGAHRAVEVDLV